MGYLTMSSAAEDKDDYEWRVGAGGGGGNFFVFIDSILRGSEEMPLCVE
jgi:hypothetical protein